jgi:2-polyprenyl-3-methyl-5-hydroxy-6-metoxy-1,4-benzoquinol methylase
MRVQLAEVVDPQTRDVFQIVACDDCQHGVTTPMPADLSRYYGKKYYGNRHGMTAKYCSRRRLRLVARATRQRKVDNTGEPTERRLLDVGCGDGAFLLAAIGSGWQGVGVEMNPDPARAAGLDVHSSLAELPPGSRFDCITLWHVLEHLPDPSVELESLRPLLADGGVLLLAVPNAVSSQARLSGRHWLHRDVPRHLHHFSPHSLARYLDSAGFSLDRAWHGEFEYDLLGWSQSALNRCFAQPNVFFEILTGKGAAYGPLQRTTQLALGAACCGLALAPTWWGMVMADAGTLIVAARPTNAR